MNLALFLTNGHMSGGDRHSISELNFSRYDFGGSSICSAHTCVCFGQRGCNVSHSTVCVVVMNLVTASKILLYRLYAIRAAWRSQNMPTVMLWQDFDTLGEWLTFQPPLPNITELMPVGTGIVGDETISGESAVEVGSYEYNDWHAI